MTWETYHTGQCSTPLSVLLMRSMPCLFVKLIREMLTASQRALQMTTAGEEADTEVVIYHCFYCKSLLKKEQDFLQTRNCTGFLGFPVLSRLNAVIHLMTSSTAPRLICLSQDGQELIAKGGETSDTWSNFHLLSNIPHGTSAKSQAWPSAYLQSIPRVPWRWGYLLPELRDRRGEVSGIQWYPECFVLPESVFHAGWRVPLLVAVCPRQDTLERLEQVVESPGQDHNVVHVQKGHNHYGSITNSWRGEEKRNMHIRDSHSFLACLVISSIWCHCCFLPCCGLVSHSTTYLLDTELNSITHKHSPATAFD